MFAIDLAIGIGIVVFQKTTKSERQKLHLQQSFG
jgi:hypothetical protein